MTIKQGACIHAFGFFEGGVTSPVRLEGVVVKAPIQDLEYTKRGGPVCVELDDVTFKTDLPFAECRRLEKIRIEKDSGCENVKIYVENFNEEKSKQEVDSVLYGSGCEYSNPSSDEGVSCRVGCTIM